jgi:hypothetical protein
MSVTHIHCHLRQRPSMMTTSNRTSATSSGSLHDLPGGSPSLPSATAWLSESSSSVSATRGAPASSVMVPPPAIAGSSAEVDRPGHSTVEPLRSAQQLLNYSRRVLVPTPSFTPDSVDESLQQLFNQNKFAVEVCLRILATVIQSQHRTPSELYAEHASGFLLTSTTALEAEITRCLRASDQAALNGFFKNRNKSLYSTVVGRYVSSSLDPLDAKRSDVTSYFTAKVGAFTLTLRHDTPLTSCTLVFYV